MPYGPAMDAFPKGHRAHQIPRNRIFRAPRRQRLREDCLSFLIWQPRLTMTIAGTPSLAVEAHPSKELLWLTRFVVGLAKSVVMTSGLFLSIYG